MMSEKVVNPSTIDRQSFMKMLQYHARILNIPGGPSSADLGVPEISIPPLVSVPKNEVPQIPLYSRIRIFVKPPLYCRPSVHVKPVKLSKSLVFQRVKIDIPLIPISYLKVKEALYNLNGFMNTFGGFGKIIRNPYLQKIHFLHKFFNVLFRQLSDAHSSRFSLLERFVLNIGKVHASPNRIA